MSLKEQIGLRGLHLLCSGFGFYPEGNGRSHGKLFCRSWRTPALDISQEPANQSNTPRKFMGLGRALELNASLLEL